MLWPAAHSAVPKKQLLSAFFASHRDELRLSVRREHRLVRDLGAQLRVCYHRVSAHAGDRLVGRFDLGFFDDVAGSEPDEALLFLHGIMGDVTCWEGGRLPVGNPNWKYKRLRRAMRLRRARSGRRMPRMVTLSVPGRLPQSPWFLVARSERPHSGLMAFYTGVILPYIRRELGGCRLSLLGESMGGHSALRLYLRQAADTYDRVALLCPAVVNDLSTDASAAERTALASRTGASRGVVWLAQQIGRRSFSGRQPQAGICVRPLLDGAGLSSHPPLLVATNPRDLWGFQVGASELAGQLRDRGADVTLCSMGSAHGDIEPDTMARFLCA